MDKSSLVKGVIIGFGVAMAFLLVDQESTQGKKEMERTQENPVISDTPKTSRGYDFNNRSYHNYSDEEIRILKEKQSFKEGYIHTPGRSVPTREEQFEQHMDNNPELIEEYIDKYKD